MRVYSRYLSTEENAKLSWLKSEYRLDEQLRLRMKKNKMRKKSLKEQMNKYLFSQSRINKKG